MRHEEWYNAQMTRSFPGLLAAALLALALSVTFLSSSRATAHLARPFPTGPLPLSTFPRPPHDNGLGVHWSTHLAAQSDEATSYFVSELARMNIRWVKLLNDGTRGRDWDHTVDELVSRGIMPILRIYQRCNTPYDPGDLEDMVHHYAARGVYYYELYNEPNQSGESGGWCDSGGVPQPEYLAQIWAPAARVIYQAGGFPSLPSFFAPSQKLPGWQQAFFYRFFAALRQQGDESALYFSWAAMHNYMINHPPTYPYDDVNLDSRPLSEAEIARYQLTAQQAATINQARAGARQPGGFFLGDNLYDDTTGFFHFIAYRNQFHNLFGFDIPMISTEGGATRGSGEDPRYPVVDGGTVAEWTLWSADYMLDRAPGYYFTTMTWLLAQHALDYDEPNWEANAWYHDRNGDQEPVVDALKQRPRLGEDRGICAGADLACWEANVKPQPGRNPLVIYPRPASDNGRGVHWPPTVQPEPAAVTHYFVPELRAMNMKWVTFLQADQPQLTNAYLVEQLVASGIEPMMRVYQPFNQPYAHLGDLVAQAVPMGVHYFELYNEPNLAGLAGGWRKGHSISVERMVDLWIIAARQVRAAGGRPSLPPLAAGGTVDDLVFLRQFLDGVAARGQGDLLPGAWLPVHNYFFNHPLDYPNDPVNVSSDPLTDAEIATRGLTPAQVFAIDQARRMSRLPRLLGGSWVGATIDADSNGFRKFEAYAHLFFSRFGYYLPLIGTEGGAIIGEAEDHRYPPVTDRDLTQRTLGAYHAMLDGAPGYFFAQTSWLLANRAGGNADARFEAAAWYKDRAGTVLPVVNALKSDERRDAVRAWQEPPLPNH